MTSAQSAPGNFGQGEPFLNFGLRTTPVFWQLTQNRKLGEFMPEWLYCHELSENSQDSCEQLAGEHLSLRKFKKSITGLVTRVVAVC